MDDEFDQHHYETMRPIAKPRGSARGAGTAAYATMGPGMVPALDNPLYSGTTDQGTMRNNTIPREQYQQIGTSVARNPFYANSRADTSGLENPYEEIHPK